MQEQYRQLQEATKQQAILMFMEITQVEDQHQAEVYLNASHYDVEAATHSYLQDPGKVLREMKQAENARRLKQLMRTTKKGDKDHLWRPVANGDPVRFPLNPPKGQVGGQLFVKNLGQDFFPKVNFQKNTLEECLKKSISTHKPLFIFVYLGDLITFHQHQIFTQCVTQYLNSNFISLGLVKSTADYNRLLPLIKPSTTSFFVILRVNMFDELIVINELVLEKKKQEEVMAVLRNALRSEKEDREEEMTVIKTFKDQGVMQHINQEGNGEDDQERSYHDEEDPHEEINLQEMRMMREMQEREFQESHAEHIRKRSQQVAQQQLEKQQQEALEKVAQDRQIRKMSMPDEPASGGQGVMRIAFRTPTGAKVLRNFYKDDTVEFVYSFVELNDQIQMENELHRKFDILTFMPSQSLENRKGEKLKDVFEDSDQETLLIKQI